MMRRPLLAALALLVLAPAPLVAQAVNAPAGRYDIEKTHASVTASVKHLGLSNYPMRFVTFDSSVTLDPADPTKSSVVFTIDPKSVRTEFPFPEKENFDAVVANRFLKAEAHPQIRFQSTGLTRTGGNTGRLAGNMTMGGVTRPVTFDVTLNGAMTHPFRKVPVVGFSATGVVKRSEFGLTELVGPIGDEVTITIEAEYLKAQ